MSSPEAQMPVRTASQISELPTTELFVAVHRGNTRKRPKGSCESRDPRAQWLTQIMYFTGTLLVYVRGTGELGAGRKLARSWREHYSEESSCVLGDWWFCAVFASHNSSPGMRRSMLRGYGVITCHPGPPSAAPSSTATRWFLPFL